MAYQVKLSEFEGPLDLLLHLIEKAEVDIKDIFVSDITSQYLEYMDQVDTLDMETASEFLTVAATLLYIKSKSLLPKPAEDQADEIDQAELLLRQLRDYQAYKNSSETLLEMFNKNRGAFIRLPMESALPPQQYRWEGVSLDELYAAFCEIASRTESADAEQNQNIAPDRFTIRMQLKKLRDILQKTPSVIFNDLFDNTSVKLEVIVTFLAVLEMLSRGEIALYQEVPFGEIRIKAKQLITDDAQLSYADESSEDVPL